MKDWLAQLEAGSLVVVDQGYHSQAAHVERVTATQIIVGATRFNRKTGYRCGDSGGMTRAALEQATPERLERVNKRRLTDALSGLRREALEKLPTHKLKEACDALDLKVSVYLMPAE